MKPILLLTEYHLRAIRRPLLWLLLCMGPVQFAGMLLGEGPYYVLPCVFYRFGMFITALCMILAAALSFWSAAQQNGHSKGIYTLMTLPIKRQTLFFAAVISSVIAVWLVIFAQALWFLLLHLPMSWANQLFSDSTLTALVETGKLARLPDHSSFQHNGLFLSMMRTPVMRVLMPLNLTGFVYLFLSILCPITGLQAILCRRGGMRGLHILLFCYSALASLFGLGVAIVDFVGLMSGELLHFLLGYCLHQLVLTLGIGWSACYGLAHSKNI